MYNSSMAKRKRNEATATPATTSTATLGTMESAWDDRDAAILRSRKRRESIKNISKLPAVENQARKDAGKLSLEFFARTYFPLTFTLPFSPDHRHVIAKIETAVRDGGLFALAMPRGSGKTTLSEIACLWAILYGYHSFVFLIGSDAAAATQMLESIKTELESNDLLLGGFPEACHPIRELEGEPRRCKGQMYEGERTLSHWGNDEIVLPTMLNSPSSGAIVQTTGITGGVRGAKFKRPDGKSVRPSLVVVDDPQTDASANSSSQCQTRERTLAGAVLGLAGPGKKISGVMPCTVIREGDLADRMLDSDLHPEWNGSRFKLVYEFPANKEIWEKYRSIMQEYDPGTPGDKERAAADATQHYLDNCDAMNEGAKVAWPERYNPDELSAVQHAMNLLYQDERAFHAEYQNTPLPEITEAEEGLTADEIADKINRLPRGSVSLDSTRLTAFIDVQQTVLYYVVCGWAEDFTGTVIDYGTFPGQGKAFFNLRDITNTLAGATGVDGLEAQIYTGLDMLTAQLLDAEWIREDNTTMRIERCLIDANWGQSTDVVYQFCRQSRFPTVVMPAHGKFVGASSNPLTSRPKKPGERIGLNWFIPVAARRAIRHVVFDSNYWKSFLHTRLAVPMGARGCLSLFGNTPNLHRMLANHLTSEYRVKVTGRGRTVDEWKLTPSAENHWLDCCSGAALAASIQGASLDATPATKKVEKRPFMTMNEMKKERAGEREKERARR